jgi:hypothetical protein
MEARQLTHSCISTDKYTLGMVETDLVFTKKAKAL